jgi:hypothetical protein
MAAFSAGTLAFAWPVSVGHSARAADVSFKLVNGVCGSGQVTVGQGCWDQQVSFFKQNWSVNDGTATYTAADVQRDVQLVASRDDHQVGRESPSRR